MNTIRVRVEPYHGTIGAYTPTVPIAVPDLNAVRQLAHRLHETGEAWQGDAFGWSQNTNRKLTNRKQKLRSTMQMAIVAPCAKLSGLQQRL